MNSVIDRPRRAELHLQKIASDTAHHLHRGCSGNAAGFDVIVLETRHGGR